MRFDQGNRFYIKPSRQYKKNNQLVGLCGNFNGNPDDDRRRRNNLEITPDAPDTAFAQEWKDGDCPDPTSLDACSLYSDRARWATKGTLFWETF